MAQWFLDHGHTSVRLHPPQWDLRNVVHIERIVALVEQAYARGFRIYLWIALPCTPWSSWQHINAAVNNAIRL
eukprot:7075609-Heterocapsa_arctica.AAC.1